jgi:hypothetical protein
VGREDVGKFYMATRSPEHLFARLYKAGVYGMRGGKVIFFGVTRYRVFVVQMCGSKGSCESKMENLKISKMSKNRKRFSYVGKT